MCRGCSQTNSRSPPSVFRSPHLPRPQRSLPNAAAAVREFQRDEAEMAERLGVVPGSTNAVPESHDEKPKSKPSRRNKSN